MLDFENRLSAAKSFLEDAREVGSSNPEYVWYIQATVVFAIAAVENITYDYAERTGQPVREQRLDLKGFIRKFPNEKFYSWLQLRLDGNDLYTFLRKERNWILHRGEPRKDFEIVIAERIGGGASVARTRVSFQGWKKQSVEEACESLIEWFTTVVNDGKREYPALNG